MDVASDDEEGWAAVKSWYGDNTEYEGAMPELAYPVDILYETENGNKVFSTIFSSTSDNCVLVLESPILPTSGGLIIGVNPVPPMPPRLDIVKVPPFKSLVNNFLFFALSDKAFISTAI